MIRCLQTAALFLLAMICPGSLVAATPSEQGPAPDDEYWTYPFPGPGIISRVIALHVHNGKLCLGGTFGSVYAWDGVSWSALGTAFTNADTDPNVQALTSYNSMLIAGGLFHGSGGVPLSRVAAWNGTAWSALGAGIDSGAGRSVAALAVYDGKLIAGGLFATAGGSPAANIAAWDGATWAPLGSGTNGRTPHPGAGVVVPRRSRLPPAHRFDRDPVTRCTCHSDGAPKRRH